MRLESRALAQSPRPMAMKAVVEPQRKHSRPYRRFDSHTGATREINGSGSRNGAAAALTVTSVMAIHTNLSAD